MCNEAFDFAFSKVLGHEGGFQAHHHDRGNWTTGIVGKGKNRGTKFGITAMTYPDEDIKGLTVERAKELYLRDFWEPLSLGVFTEIEAYLVFDMAVNSGLGNAIRNVQKSVGVVADGAIGPITLKAIEKRQAFPMAFLANRLQFFTYISTWDHYGKGWSRRIVTQMKEVADYETS